MIFKSEEHDWFDISVHHNRIDIRCDHPKGREALLNMPLSTYVTRNDYRDHTLLVLWLDRPIRFEESVSKFMTSMLTGPHRGNP